MQYLNGQEIQQLIDRQEPWRALEQRFYCDPEIYQREIDRVLLRSWLYAGHISEIPNTGDYMLLEFAGESVIIIRAADEEIYALVNVCRHRGSRICFEKSGNEKRLTCRYHGWTYGLDGVLRAAAHMPETFDKTGIGLKRLHLRVFQGMIFVNFADKPGNFDLIDEELGPRIAPYGLDRARVAHRESYPIRANWKLAVENYKECYHCAPSHPEYSRAHALAMPDKMYADEYRELLKRGVSCGLSDAEFNHSYEDSGEFGTDRAFERYPLMRRHVTGSEDGQQLAPLLGSIRGFDRGASDFKVGPLLYALAYCDHVVLYRFLPTSIDESDCDITWLVHEDAVEGRDYDLEKLTWLWDVTTKADKRIIEANHQGVMSRYFVPGPLSTMEGATNRWNLWYLEAIRD
jgi:phenylpropionate dioxygenase-like ring-hydroxylating dioxygenase large terminal subunit